MELNVQVTNDPIIVKQMERFHGINEWIEKLEVTDETAGDASDNLRLIKTQIKEINSRRLDITRPIDQAKAEVMKQVKQVLAPLESAKRLLESKLLSYQVEKRRKEEEHQRYLLEQERKRLEAERKELEEQAELNQSEYALDEAIKVEDEIKSVEAVEVKSTGKVKADFSTTSLSYKWTFKVVDLSKVPDQYKMLNEVLVRKVIAGKNGIHEIPGLEITKQPILSTRGRF